MSSAAEIKTPKTTPEIARIAAEQMALMLQVRLLDKGVKFEEAAKAAIRAVPTFRDVAIGMVEHTDVVAIDLGDERGGMVKIYPNMEAAVADRELARHRHVAVQCGDVLADVLQAAQGKIIDAVSIN